MKKYELIEDDQVEVGGHTLYRIRALRSFDRIKVGKLGGYIEKEDNLSHDGNCWVYNDAKVFSNAKVSDNATVRDNAVVRDNALIYGNASVYEDAVVSERSRVFDNAEVHGNAKVLGDSNVYGSAKVYNHACVYGAAKVYGNADVYKNASVGENAMVYDNTLMGGNAVAGGNATMHGSSVLRGNAMVLGNANVHGKATVCGDAVVRGNADVCGDAVVGGGSAVRGEANISKKLDIIVFCNVGSSNGILTVYRGKNGKLLATRGCFEGTVEEFLAKSKREHNEKIHQEYKLLIEVAKSRILIEPITELLLDPELTHGEKLVGITFNVGSNTAVHACKKRFADAIDQLEAERESADANGTLNANKQHLIEEAQMRILDAQMWAVKAVTYGL